ncbi:MAG: AAA family ATPase [Paracoccaceae bacterium]
MASNAALQSEPAPIVACTVSRDVQNFDLLIEDMETELGEGWGDLSFGDAATFLEQPDAEALEFIAIAVDEKDEKDLPAIGDLIRTAKEKRIRVILIAEELSPVALHQLLRLGADDFVPYPLPEGALHEAIDRLRHPVPTLQAVPDGGLEGDAAQTLRDGSSHDAVILPVHGLAGGVGASTLAVNLAWELTQISKKDAPRVCLIDLDLQFGASSTYLDLPRRDAIYELLADTSAMDDEAFMQALQTFQDKLFVFTAPLDILPLDFVTPEDITALLNIARRHFDFIVIDMPTTLVQWTDTVLNEAHVYFALVELDMRSAQNTLRLIRALKSEDLPFEKLRFALNRAPKFTDLSGKSRAKRMAESLDIDIELMLPDGGRQVTQSGDHGLPLSGTAKKNPLRKEISQLAASLLAHAQGEAAAK